MLGGARVVDQGVELAVWRGGNGDLAAVGIVADVALHEPCLGAGSLDGRGGCLRLLATLGIVQDEGLGATLGRPNGDGRAKTRPTACHQDHLAVELAHLPLPSAVADRLAFTPSRYACVTSLPSRRPSL